MHWCGKQKSFKKKCKRKETSWGRAELCSAQDFPQKMYWPKRWLKDTPNLQYFLFKLWIKQNIYKLWIKHNACKNSWAHKKSNDIVLATPKTDCRQNFFIGFGLDWLFVKWTGLIKPIIKSPFTNWKKYVLALKPKVLKLEGLSFETRPTNYVLKEIWWPPPHTQMNHYSEISCYKGLKAVFHQRSAKVIFHQRISPFKGHHWWKNLLHRWPASHKGHV